MNQSKFSYSEIIAVIVALGFGAMCCASVYVKTLGSAKESLITAIVISFTLWFLTFLLVRMKKASRNFKRWCVLQGVVLLFFVGAAFIALQYYSHYFTVSKHKTEIQQKTSDNILQISDMFEEYRKYSESRIKKYTDNLETAIQGRNANPSNYKKWGFNSADGVPDRSRKESLVKELLKGLYETGYNELNTIANTWLSDAKNKCEKWRPLLLVDIINSVDKQGVEWEKQLLTFSENAKMQGEDFERFDYKDKASFNDVTSLFKDESSPSLIAILTAIAIYLLMLFPWMITNKHPRNNIPCMKLLFGKKINYTEGRL